MALAAAGKAQAMPGGAATPRPRRAACQVRARYPACPVCEGGSFLSRAPAGSDANTK